MEAWAVKRPPRNKVCWVSNLQGKVTVLGNVKKKKNVGGRERVSVCERETMVLDCDFTSRLTSKHVHVLRYVTSLLLMRMVSGGCRTAIGRGGGGEPVDVDDLYASRGGVSISGEWFRSTSWTPFIHLSKTGRSALLMARCTLTLRSVMQELYILTFAHSVFVHACVSVCAFFVIFAKGSEVLFPHIILTSHHLCSLLRCLPPPPINNTASFGLDSTCNGVCITSSTDWPGDLTDCFI